ncbi:activator of Hsp90 ATPase, putative [Plasmodium malariae]|uniref:Activator of Hsp90 ATPase, putative n=3 Tax=Plasmodium malariae TaxID=5858 RepID=A0A1D3PB97_PLAMA|nr:activator of Hsp90 ATPase, putative [Plasmodium malariae]SCN12370.1 activator of Hsp90 ATPase, putative [Plasmodium malariae]
MAGSVWNRNSWHWEEKNYSKWGESYIKYKLNNLKLETEQLSIYFDKFDITGNASVSVRKGKQINSFEYDIKFSWFYLKTTENKECSGGNVEILDFSICSVEDNDYEINVQMNEDKEESRKAYDILRKEGKEKIKNALKGFPSDLLKHDTDESNKETKIKGDEEEKLQNIKTQNNNENERHNIGVNNINNNTDQEKKEGSVWNINNYHWEEKCLTKWAKEELKNILDKTKIELSNNILLEFFCSEVEGEASSSLRKKKKILIYDLKVSCEWKAFKKNKNNGIEMETKGHVSVNEIISDYSSDDENKYKYNFVFDNTISECMHINHVVKMEAPSKIEKVIDEFISKMRDK